MLYTSGGGKSSGVCDEGWKELYAVKLQRRKTLGGFVMEEDRHFPHMLLEGLTKSAMS